jgi:hypothetical protein
MINVQLSMCFVSIDISKAAPEICPPTNTSTEARRGGLSHNNDAHVVPVFVCHSDMDKPGLIRTIDDRHETSQRPGTRHAVA